MKTIHPIIRRLPILALIAGLGLSSSCMTTYDSSGRPVQSVDPGLAVAGVAAAGLLGYAAANNNNHHNHYRGGYYDRPYYGGGYYRGGPYRRYR